MPATHGAEEPDRDPSEHWEYATVLLQGDIMTACNHAGRKGWEIIQIEQQPTGEISAFCKRRPQKILLATAIPSRLSLHT